MCCGPAVLLSSHCNWAGTNSCICQATGQVQIVASVKSLQLGRCKLLHLSICCRCAGAKQCICQVTATGQVQTVAFGKSLQLGRYKQLRLSSHCNWQVQTVAFGKSLQLARCKLLPLSSHCNWAGGNSCLCQAAATAYVQIVALTSLAK